MDRRQFLATSAAAAAAGPMFVASARGQSDEPSGKPFNLKYAPHHGHFRHHAGDGHVDQIRFAGEAGFRAWEDNGLGNRPKDLQEKIAKELERQAMTMGVFVATGSMNNATFASDDEEATRQLQKDMEKAVEVAKRVNAKWTTVVPGAHNQKLEMGYQTANVIENLKRCAEICEPAGLVMVLEPLNRHNHPGLFLTEVPQAYQICRAVNSPSCKILDDLYHQQITEGHLIPNMDRSWDEIPYFQVGDVPGRNEPTTGEINFYNVFKHIYDKGFDGVIGMEHGKSRSGKEGEKRLIEAYREVDSFPT
jgi:hydroxypyruvate isomerase